MQVRVEDGLSVGWTVHSFKRGKLSACFTVKSAYQLQNGKAPLPIKKTEPLSGDLHTDDDPAKSLVYPSDFALPKPRADFLVLATAFAPGKKPVPRFDVSARVGKMTKRLTVSGKRTWQKALLRKTAFTDPEPTVGVPIIYENAFGGPRSKKNPLGRGMDSDDLPLIDFAQRPVTNPKDDVDPAGFGPVAASWHPRAGLVGTYNEVWLKEHWPWFPEDFDYAYYNAAPRDQQIEGYLRGDEELQFENLHAQHANYQCKLPGIRARCFFSEQPPKGTLKWREVPLQLDTVWIDLGKEKLVLVWRGIAEVQSLKLREVEQVFACTELVAERPKPPEHYQGALGQRLQSEREEAEESKEEAADDAEFARQFAQMDLEIAQMEAEVNQAEAAALKELANEKALLIARGIDPARLEPSIESGSAGLELRALAAEGKLRPDQVKGLERGLVEAEQAEAEIAAMDKQFEADFPPPLTRDAVVASAYRSGGLAEKDLSELDLSGQKLAGVNFRGAVLRQTKLVKTNLAGANLTGADLSEADLSEADLTGANLDDADLSGAVLKGAKLTGVSLRGTNLSGLNLAQADLSGCTGRGADFSESDLTKAKFVGAKLPASYFSKCKLAGADFRNAEIPRADLDGVQAAGIILESANVAGLSASKADLKGGNFKRIKGARAVFEKATLDRADFSRASLGRAQFSEASLPGAVFDRADVSSGSFEDAVLRKAQMTNANLMRVSFDRADLTEADLKGSNLYEAGLWGTVLEKADYRTARVKGTRLS
jgi:uncharacterized protein YjbI with pentapeptide repeats